MTKEELAIARRMFYIMAENLLKDENEKFRLSSLHISLVVYIYNSEPTLSTNYHLEFLNNNLVVYLWRRKAWVNYSAKVEADRKAQEAYNLALDERKEIFFDICSKICELLGVEDKAPFNQAIRILAEKALAKKSGGELLNMDLSNVPELPTMKPHTVLDDRGKKDYTI